MISYIHIIFKFKNTEYLYSYHTVIFNFNTVLVELLLRIPRSLLLTVSVRIFVYR